MQVNGIIVDQYRFKSCFCKISSAADWLFANKVFVSEIEPYLVKRLLFIFDSSMLSLERL
jgi:hypothetical protein